MRSSGSAWQLKRHGRALRYSIGQAYKEIEKIEGALRNEEVYRGIHVIEAQSWKLRQIAQQMRSFPTNYRPRASLRNPDDPFMVVKTLRHKCAVDGCEQHIDHSLLMCKEHWFKVPERLRTQVKKYFRYGPHSKYLEAREKAIACVPLPTIPHNPQMVLR